MYSGLKKDPATKQDHSKSLSEKETLLKMSPGKTISSLFHRYTESSGPHVEDPKAQAVLKEGQNRVKSMALIHQSLSKQNLTSIK